MSGEITRALVISLLVTCALSHVATWKTPNQLHPVHGLYVKPSSDGATGDLYVAATEESGSKTQWLTDQPINFLPVGAATQQHQTTIPYTPAHTASSHEEGQSTQKRAVVTSPPVQYAYALPYATGTDGALPYPYTVPATTTPTQTSSTEASTTPKCGDTPTSPVPYNPFQYFYPHLMSAYANAMSILKDTGMSEDTAGAIVSQASPMWSPYGAYPMYVMVDPNAWSQTQTTQSSSSSATSNESSR